MGEEMKRVPVEYDEETKEYYIPWLSFANVVDLEKVKFYELDKKENGTIKITFYDENEVQIKAKEE